MELYGSLFNISGSVTASAFTGSYIGDGAGLYNLPASGVTGLNLSQISSGGSVAAITSTGFTVNTNTQVQGNLSVTGALIANQYIVSSSVVYMTTSFASGSSAFGNDNNDVHQFTGSVQITGSISLNGQAIGTGKLDETVFQSYTSSNDTRVLALETSSGSLNSFTSSINTTIKSKLDNDGVISGSIQVALTGTTGYSTFSSSISSSIADVSSSVAITTSGLTSTITSLSSSVSSSIGSISSSVATTTSGLSSSIGSLSSSIATTDLNQSNRLDTIEGKTGSYATTGSNLFKGTQTHSGSILPSVDNTYDLGSATYQWRDVYISSGSLYIDGTKVISSTAQELQITTDNGQSIKILESGTDSIILQTADGDIELKSNADGDILLDPTNGKIMLKGPVEILSGQKIQSSVGGTPVVFANDIVVSGSIDITGTIEGINLTDFSSSANTRIGNLESGAGSLNSYTSSNTTNINAIHTATGSLNTFTSSINTTIKSKLDNDGVISGSVQVVLTGTTGYSTFSSSVSTSIGSLSGSIAITTSDLSSSVGSLSSSVATTTSGLTSTITSLSSSVSSSIGSLSSSVATTTSGLSSSIGSLSSSVATTTSDLSSSIGSLSSSVATTTSNIQGRATSLEGKTGSYATTGSNIFQGDQTITGSLFVSQNLIIAGSSSIQHISSSVLNIADNIITVNAVNPSVRFGGLAVIDSGSSPQVSGSMLFDSVNNQWVFVHQNQASVTSSVLLMGPETYNDLGNETYITANRLVKSTGIEHLTNSNISDDGTTVTILSNTVINGTISSTGTTIVSGSSQISHDSTTGYVANRHIDHTSVSISAGSGLSGGGDISATRTVSLDTGSVHFLDGVKKELNTEGVISGSSQVLNGSGVWSGSAQLPSGVVSGSSQVLSGTGIWSGSSQLPSGVVSGSSQVLAGTTIHSGAFFNGISVVSGSAQISFNGITDKPTLVSGSSQITYGSLTGIPSGIVSGSSQITFGSISSIPGGLVSGSSQIDLTATTNYSTGIKTRLNAEGVLSGSSQVTGIGNAQLTNSSFFVGTTSISLGRASASQTLTGVSIDGNAATVTNFSGTHIGTSSGTNTGDVTETLATVTGRGNTTTTSMGIGSNSIPNGKLYVNGGSGTDVIAIQNTLNTGAYLVFADNVTPTWANAPRLGAINNDMVFKILDVERFRMASTGATFTTTISASNLSGTNTGDQTLSGLGGLSNNTDSEQTVGGKAYYFNSGAGRMNADPRWNESGYDADLGCLHLWSWTAAGVAYGRAGIAFYNDNAYQYLTTKSNTTGLFVNNSLIATAGSSPTFSNVKGSSYFDAQASSGFRIRNSNDTANAGGFTRRGLWEGNANYDPGMWAETGYGLYFYSNGSGTPKTVITTNGTLLHGHTAAPDVNAWLGTAVFGVSGYNKVIIGSLNSTTTGAYIGGHTSALNAWADINVAGEAIIFRYQQTERARFDTSGHFIPGANNSYNLGSASLGWANVYTNDLHLSNMNKPEGNDIDGTNGNWTIQEGAEQLYIINNNNGKKFKIDLTEII